MKIVLLTYFLDNYRPVFDLVRSNKDQYCARHGYLHLAKTGPYHNPNWYYGFQKMQYLYDLMFDSAKTGMNIQPDIVWSLNIQSVITNCTHPLTDYIDHYDDYDFWAAKDTSNDINMGSFIIRKSDWSKKWLRFILDKEPEYERHWYEQSVVQDFWRQSPWKEKIQILPQNVINAYRFSLYKWPEHLAGNWRPGDFVISFPATSLEERINLLQPQNIGPLIIS